MSTTVYKRRVCTRVSKCIEAYEGEYHMLTAGEKCPCCGGRMRLWKESDRQQGDNTKPSDITIQKCD